MDAVEHRVEVGQALGQQAGLVRVAVETIERDRRHRRAVRLAHEAGQGLAEGLGRLAALLRAGTRASLHAAGGFAAGGHHRTVAHQAGGGVLGHGFGGQAAGQRGAQQRVVAVEVLQQHRQARLGVNAATRRPGGGLDLTAQQQGRRRANGDRVYLALRRQGLDGAVQPAGGGRIDPGRAGLQHVLRLEVRARAVGRRDRGDDARLAGPGHGVHGGKLRMERERPVERQRVVQRQAAAQALVLAVADRRGDRQAIHAAAADHHDDLLLVERRLRRQGRDGQQLQGQAEARRGGEQTSAGGLEGRVHRR